MTWIEFESVSAFHHSYTLWPLISNNFFDIGKFCFYILIPFDPFWPHAVLWTFWNELISFDPFLTSDCSLNFWNEFWRFFSPAILVKNFPLVLKHPVVFFTSPGPKNHVGYCHNFASIFVQHCRIFSIFVCNLYAK